MTRVIEVRTGARLHFGLFTAAGAGRPGGIGMMIDRPGLTIRVSPADEDDIRGPAEVAEKARHFLSLLREGLAPWPEAATERYRIEIADAIPLHRGYGSGTQLAWALVRALTALLGFKPTVPYGNLSRGTRSTVGLSGFCHGGFVIDPGGTDAVPFDPRFAAHGGTTFGAHRFPVPPSWRVVVVEPSSGAGLSGLDERAAFARLPSACRDDVGELDRLVIDAIGPGLAEARFNQFAAGVAEFNRLVGEYFAPAQGGVYAHPLIRGLARTLADSDWPHLAQSSWGPAAAVFCESEESAEELRSFLAGRVPPHEADIFVAAPRNTGAEVRVIDDAK